MNLIEAITEGQKGKNLGFRFPLNKIDRDIYGILKGAIYTVGAKPKVGKTAFVDFNFIIGPFMIDEKFRKENVKIHYFSFEIKRIVKEAKFLSFWFHHVKNRQFLDDKEKYLITAPLLLGWMRDDNGNVISLDPIEKEIKEGYEEFIVPLFGRYDKKGNRIEEGIIDFIDIKENPTGIFNYAFSIAEKEGKFIYEEYTKGNQKKRRVVGYMPLSEKTHIFIVDHVRKLQLESIAGRKFTMKENIDKLLDYEVILRDKVNFSFVNIIHLNDEDISAIRLAGEYYVPAIENFKDSRNFAEDSDFLFALMDPTYSRYSFTKHFGVNVKLISPTIKDKFGNHYHYRVAALISSRYGNAPVIYRLLFNGATGAFIHYNPEMLN